MDSAINRAQAAFSTRRERTATMFKSENRAFSELVTKLSGSGCYRAANRCGFHCTYVCLAAFQIARKEIHPTACEEGGQKKKKNRDWEIAAQRKKGRMKGFCEMCWGEMNTRAWVVHLLYTSALDRWKKRLVLQYVQQWKW